MCLDGSEWPTLFNNNILQVIKKQNTFKGEGLTLSLGSCSFIGYLT